MSHHTHVEIRNPGSMTFSPNVKKVLTIFALLGIISIITGILTQPARAWPNFLLNYFYFLALGLFGAFFVALQHITNAYWSVTVRRFAEGLMSYLPIAFILGLVLLLGSHHLYEWTHHEVVENDHLLHLKAPYLNMKFFVVRLVLFFAIWVGLGWKMRKNSLAQDVSGDHKLTLSNVKLSAAFIPLFGISFTLASFDLLMSLEPHWFSTIYGIYCFAGMVFSGFSLLAILTIYGRRRGIFTDQMVNENHIHDIGKMMFAFTVFWAYIMFSQLMLQWYANLPEETIYYIRRFNGGWWPYFWGLLIVHFVIPFFLLLPRGAKRNQKFLFRMAFFMLFAQWLDAYFLVMPVFFKNGPVFGWIELGTLAGFAGVFGLSIVRFLENVPAIPVKDPRLAQCVGHAQ